MSTVESTESYREPRDFANEDHVSVSLASLGRALTFALKP